jgi:hypothetical protein
MTNQMMAAAAERTSAADVQQLVQCSRCSWCWCSSRCSTSAAAGASAAASAGAAQVYQLCSNWCNAAGAGAVAGASAAVKQNVCYMCQHVQQLMRTCDTCNNALTAKIVQYRGENSRRGIFDDGDVDVHL